MAGGENIPTKVQTVRLLITDTSKTGQLFTDTEITDLLALYDGDERRTAARALRTIAASEVLLSKKITTQDLSTDGPAVSAELRALADELDAEAQVIAEASRASFAEYIPPAGVCGLGRNEAEEWVYATGW